MTSAPDSLPKASIAPTPRASWREAWAVYLQPRVLKLQKHFGDVNEDVRQILISADKIEKRAGRIEELDFSKAEAPAEPAPLARPAAAELFPLARKLRAGE